MGEVFWKSSLQFLVVKENKHQTKQSFIKTLNNSIQMDLKGKQIFRVGNAAGFGWKQGIQTKKNKIMNLLRKINRHIKLIGEKIKRGIFRKQGKLPRVLSRGTVCIWWLEAAPSENRHWQWAPEQRQAGPLLWLSGRIKSWMPRNQVLDAEVTSVSGLHQNCRTKWSGFLA